jgi:hypothetical protein
MQATPIRLFCSSACQATQASSKKVLAPAQQRQYRDGLRLVKEASHRKKQKHRARTGSDPIAAAVYAQPPEDASTYLAPFFRPSFDLAQFNQILDIHPQAFTHPSDKTTVVHINSESSPLFPTPDSAMLEKLRSMAVSDDAGENADPLRQLANDKSLNFTVRDLRNLHRYALVTRRVVNMTSKGKQPSMSVLTVVGDGNGMLGYGEGKAENITQASDKAFVQAVKNMDYVQRKEDRTVWSESMKTKWGATVVEIRSRPPGMFIRKELGLEAAQDY